MTSLGRGLRKKGRKGSEGAGIEKGKGRGPKQEREGLERKGFEVAREGDEMR